MWEAAALLFPVPFRVQDLPFTTPVDEPEVPETAAIQFQGLLK